MASKYVYFYFLYSLCICFSVFVFDNFPVQEQNALKGGKKAMAKMETRVRELESEMDAENRRCTDAQKNLRRSERHIKELTYQQDEDRKNHERMQGLIDQLQGKIKSYKKQIEEAEEIAALNLAKYRQVRRDYELQNHSLLIS